MHRQALRIGEDMALLAFDFFARIEAGCIDLRPPFSALFTLWLSRIAAVGLASRRACSRHFTYKTWWMRSSVPSQFQRSK